MQEEVADLREKLQEVLAVMNPLVEQTLKIDIEKEYAGLFDRDEKSGKYEVNEKNCLQIMGIVE